MTEFDLTRLPGRPAARALAERLVDWLVNEALPLWAANGVDREGGGYFENLAATAAACVPCGGEIRRGRVVARQIYVFDVGRRLGWRTPHGDLALHGCDYLFSRLHAGQGHFHTNVDATTYRPLGPFSLYEQAFYLFALARLACVAADRHPVTETAARCLQRLRRDFGRTGGGFEESKPPSVPLKSNPHMHLLEAALAWIEAGDTPNDLWVSLAAELVGVCLTHFRDPSTGAVREYFDSNWRPMPDNDGRVVEPGHQFEWSWLLMQWARSPHCDDGEREECMRAARRLMQIGETFGVDGRRGVAINELWDDLNWKDASAKLWPQTERLKAACAMLTAAESTPEAERALDSICNAGAGLLKYLRTDIPGLWHEVCAEDGSFQPGPSKASSLYHIACAIDVLRDTMDRSGNYS